MSEPWGTIQDMFEGPAKPPQECPDPEACLELHNETGHHYGCECAACLYEYWMLKQ